ncbi:hypothetical protein [Legionella sainthelensi]|uniref:Uncharacterized protein n=1 Tax=Legionella sainthelensi TaxID=28087 RepID=A0A2H5FRS4_9GAMM|nr:hypothetical protein [Legionella sainthelensi]AUH74267.1 hypothetical protein CAB17_20225 [Legionella sainthelensi]
MHSEDYMGYEYNPKTVISELILYDRIYDEYLDGIEELIEKEKQNFSSEMQFPSDEMLNPELEPIEITKYRNFWDFESGPIDYFNKKLPSLIRGSGLGSNGTANRLKDYIGLLISIIRYVSFYRIVNCEVVQVFSLNTDR